jgi:hypothetical protein
MVEFVLGVSPPFRYFFAGCKRGRPWQEKPLQLDDELRHLDGIEAARMQWLDKASLRNAWMPDENQGPGKLCQEKGRVQVDRIAWDGELRHLGGSRVSMPSYCLSMQSKQGEKKSSRPTPKTNQ